MGGARRAGRDRVDGRDRTECGRVVEFTSRSRLMLEPETGRRGDGRRSIARFPARSPAIVAGVFRRIDLAGTGDVFGKRTGLEQSTTKTLVFLALVGGAIVWVFVKDSVNWHLESSASKRAPEWRTSAL